MHRLLTFAGNLLWLLSTLPGWVLFQFALRRPKRAQQHIRRRINRQNKETSALAGQAFEQLPLQDYENLLPDIERIMEGESNILTAEPVRLLEPTGGSTTGTKLIPYTKSLQREFQRAIDPWICSLFIRWPSLLFGRHYWSITPSTKTSQHSAVPIGFDEDAAYLGRTQQFITRHIFAVPPGVKHSQDVQSTEFITLVHLLNCPDLRLVSVWHPSLLTLMLHTLETRFEELLQTLESGVSPSTIHGPHALPTAQRRAAQLRAIGCRPAAIWKKLKVISCWSGPACQPWIDQIQAALPGAVIQAKGLVATEGISSIPLGTVLDVAAVRSHGYEFECTGTGKIMPLWNVEEGKTYHLILTTGGGLYRYRTNDLVEITGCVHRTPRIRFLTRNNMTSDLVGEKISLAQAEQLCRNLPCPYRYAMIAPEKTGDTFRYALYIETDSTMELEAFVEAELSRNYHYEHARNLGQLQHAVVQRIENGNEKVSRHLSNQGQRPGSIKPTRLRLETDWDRILRTSGR